MNHRLVGYERAQLEERPGGIGVPVGIEVGEANVPQAKDPRRVGRGGGVSTARGNGGGLFRRLAAAGARQDEERCREKNEAHGPTVARTRARTTRAGAASRRRF